MFRSFIKPIWEPTPATRQIFLEVYEETIWENRPFTEGMRPVYRLRPLIIGEIVRLEQCRPLLQGTQDEVIERARSEFYRTGGIADHVICILGDILYHRWREQTRR